MTKIKELEELLDKLPEIFESKFTQRLAPVLERQRLLLEENLHLRAQVEQLMSQLGNVRLEFPQAQSRQSIAFIGLKPASTSSLQPLTENQWVHPSQLRLRLHNNDINCMTLCNASGTSTQLTASYQVASTFQIDGFLGSLADDF